MFTVFCCNDTATTEICTLSLHDALPICSQFEPRVVDAVIGVVESGLVEAGEAYSDAVRAVLATHPPDGAAEVEDRKSTRLNSSHANTAYAVFCLKKKTVTPSRR